MAFTALPSPVPPAGTSTSWFAVAKSAGGLVATVAGLLATVAVAVATVALRAGGYLATAGAWLLAHTYSVAAWPVARLVGLVRFVVSPVTYTLSYALKPVLGTIHLLGRLSSLYTFLGSAAFVGIVTGLVLKFASDYIVGTLGLDSDTDTDKQPDAGDRKPLRYSMTPATKTARPRPATVPFERLVKREDNDDGDGEDVWQWLDEFSPRPPAIATDNSTSTGSTSTSTSNQLAGAGQRPTRLLSSLTILEESSSDGGITKVG